MLAKLRSDYPYHWQIFEVSNQDMKYPYRRARTVHVVPVDLASQEGKNNGGGGDVIGVIESFIHSIPSSSN